MVLYVPLEQRGHDVAPVPLWKVPCTQNEQFVACISVTYVPAVHAAHAVKPYDDEKVPGVQFVHFPLFVRPSALP